MYKWGNGVMEKKELSSLRSQFTIDWNDGMLEYWNVGFGKLG
jgi:hypothetical protein